MLISILLRDSLSSCPPLPLRLAALQTTSSFNYPLPFLTTMLPLDYDATLSIILSLSLSLFSCLFLLAQMPPCHQHRGDGNGSSSPISALAVTFTG